ncbi:hypothetical protein QJS66_06560 [Kocuria rhizophila]|nr:hypothetical protein QJS66_06560 [Kocuria rhizophila]
MGTAESSPVGRRPRTSSRWPGASSCFEGAVVSYSARRQGTGAGSAPASCSRIAAPRTWTWRSPWPGRPRVPGRGMA